jgi:hypothetical protein
MVAKQAHLHGMTNNPTKYEQIPYYGLRAVAFTRCHRQMGGENYHDKRQLLFQLVL